MLPPLIGHLDEHLKESVFLFTAFIFNAVMCILCIIMMKKLHKEVLATYKLLSLCTLGIGSIIYFISHIVATKEGLTSIPLHAEVLQKGAGLRDGFVIVSLVMHMILLIRFKVSEWSTLASRTVYYIASIIISFQFVVLAHSFAEPALEMWYEFNSNSSEFITSCKHSQQSEWIDYLTYFLTPLHHEFVVVAIGLWLTFSGNHGPDDNYNVYILRQTTTDTGIQLLMTEYNATPSYRSVEYEEHACEIATIQNNRQEKWKRFQPFLLTIAIIVAITIDFIPPIIYLLVTCLALFNEPAGNTEFYMYHNVSIALYVIVIVYTSFGLVTLYFKEFAKITLNVEEYILLLMFVFEVTFFLIKLAAVSTCYASEIVCVEYENAQEYLPASLAFAILGILQVFTQTIFLILSRRGKEFLSRSGRSVGEKQRWIMTMILLEICLSNISKWIANSLMKGVNEKDHYELEPILELLFGCVTTKIVVLVFFRFLAFYRFHSSFMALEQICHYNTDCLNNLWHWIVELFRSFKMYVRIT